MTSIQTSGSSEFLIDEQAEELRRRKLAELASSNKKKPPIQPKRTFQQAFMFYFTSLLAFMSVTGGSSLLFLVPLYVDPAISTLINNFVVEPTICVTQRREDLTGLFNCSWSSCREGCTSDVFKCSHIYVAFVENFTFPTNATANEIVNLTNSLTLYSEESILLVNIKGCGYPPKVKCEPFLNLYGQEGTIFPCYYSQLNKTIVMTHYSRDDQLKTIINFFVIPFIVTVVASIGLCILHCDCRCKKERIKRRRKPRYRHPRLENVRLVSGLL